MNTLKRLAGPAYVANSATNIYNPASNVVGIVRHIHFANTTASPHQVTIYVGATGGSAGGTELFKTFNIDGFKNVDYYPIMVMKNADFLTGLCDTASAVTITVEGEEKVLD